MQYLYPMFVTELPESSVWDLVNVNVGATTHMTKLVLPGMQKRNRGAIVNVSSSAELQPMPLMAVYAATKVGTYETCEMHSKTIINLSDLQKRGSKHKIS